MSRARRWPHRGKTAVLYSILRYRRRRNGRLCGSGHRPLRRARIGFDRLDERLALDIRKQGQAGALCRIDAAPRRVGRKLDNDRGGIVRVF